MRKSFEEKKKTSFEQVSLSHRLFTGRRGEIIKQEGHDGPVSLHWLITWEFV